MTETINSAYFRAMSKREYRRWESLSFIESGKYWTDFSLSYSGYPPEELKRWVDGGRNEFGPQDVVIQVNRNSALEFNLEFRESGLPPRYVNTFGIRFNRVKLVYDPRAVVSDNPVMELEKIIESQKIFSRIVEKFKSLVRHSFGS